MKKVLFAAILAIPVLFACNKKNTIDNTITPPKAAEQALTVDFQKATIPPTVKVTVDNKPEQVEVKTIHFLRSGKYLLEAVLVPVAKADDDILHFSGTYSYSNGTYTLSGDCSVKVDVSGGKVSVDGEEVAQATTSTPNVTAGTFEDFLYRSWTISGLEVVFTKPDVKQRVSVSAGKNVSVAVEVANKAGAKIDAAKVAGYDVQTIDIDPNCIMLKFANGKTYAGNWNVLSSGKFNFTLVEELTSGFIQDGKIEGDVEKSGEQLVAKVTVASEQVNGTIIITFDQAK